MTNTAVRDLGGRGELTKAQIALLKLVKKTRERPAVQSDDWETFCDLSDAGLLEDLGMGNARLTPRGRFVLKSTRRPALSEPPV